MSGVYTRALPFNLLLTSPAVMVEPFGQHRHGANGQSQLSGRWSAVGRETPGSSDG